MRSAGCCVNDAADKDFDAHVKRTANRPVTSGKLSQKEAVMVGAVLALLAFLLVLTTNAATIAWSFAALAIAVAYPFAKRLIAMPQAVLGVAFSFGIPMAFAAVLGSVPALAWLLLIGNLFWVLAYDTEYAMVDRDDDLKIGMKTSAITLGRFDVVGIMTFYALYLAIWHWLMVCSPYQIRLTSPLLWYASLAVACGQVIWHFLLIKNRSREGCFKAFRVNHWLGLTLCLGIVWAL
jgi:4-hydroxybenzoate polyprenyltransferase